VLHQLVLLLFCDLKFLLVVLWVPPDRSGLFS